MEEQESLFMVGGSVNLFRNYRNKYKSLSKKKKTNLESPYDSAIALVGINPKILQPTTETLACPTLLLLFHNSKEMESS